MAIDIKNWEKEFEIQFADYGGESSGDLAVPKKFILDFISDLVDAVEEDAYFRGAREGGKIVQDRADAERASLNNALTPKI